MIIAKCRRVLYSFDIQFFLQIEDTIDQMHYYLSNVWRVGRGYHQLFISNKLGLNKRNFGIYAFLNENFHLR